MPKITVELPDVLHLSLTKITQRNAVSTEDFVLRAIEEKIELLASKDDFYAIADERFKRFLKTKEAIPWSEVDEYLERRLAGETIEPPRPRKFKWPASN